MCCFIGIRGWPFTQLGPGNGTSTWPTTSFQLQESVCAMFLPSFSRTIRWWAKRACGLGAGSYGLHQATIARTIIITALAGLDHGIHNHRQSASKGKDRAQRELGRLRGKDVEQIKVRLVKFNIAPFSCGCNPFLTGFQHSYGVHPQDFWLFHEQQKAPTKRRGLKAQGELRVARRSADGRGCQSHGGGFCGGQIEGEVMSIALVHHFHAEAGTVEHIGPGVHHPTL